ncbi:HAD family hydrolase [Saccharicrinis fermentans]|uniref:Putative beta-phosphoglucomutase n=1 Tax=Saccharicrinis fermentans DSM 9555 = JCM 21142 TaxID=869213 RepID=W7Y2P6_9BACT|nr:HAD-IA family hydrolase [Saccharicrinis fermentans]GAF05085.1 putative beta-phosphoglucomutase [Saccharicrinis fermentans DSM 9555 = JCM 21142]
MSEAIIPRDLRCVIFDMDGVLYDSMKNHEIAWTGCFKTVGIDFPAYEAYLHEGSPGLETIAYVYRQYLNKEVSEEECERIYNEKIRLMGQLPIAEKMPQMGDLIDFIRETGMDVWVVTGSKQPTLLDRLSDDFGIPAKQIISASDVTKGKPDPEPYAKAVARCGFTAEQCMVVENAPLGVQSAKAAGVTTIAVNTGVLEDEVLVEAGADIVLPDTSSLYSYVRSTLQERG